MGITNDSAYSRDPLMREIMISDFTRLARGEVSRDFPQFRKSPFLPVPPPPSLLREFFVCKMRDFFKNYSRPAARVARVRR